MNYAEIESRAYSVLLKNDLLEKGKFEIDVFKIAENFSITIQKRSLSNEISGLLIIKDGKVAIGIDSDQGLQRQRFTVAHELGHYFLHRELRNTFVDETFARSGNTNQIEREANAFAAALLMPKKLIFEAIQNKNWENIDDNEIDELAKLFNVSGISMTYRLVNLKVLEQPYY